MLVLPTQTKKIDELIDIGYASKKPGNRKILLTILQNIWYLARQGLALRGDGKETDSNFMQLFLLHSIDNPDICQWLERRNDTYLSKDIQNETLLIMVHNNYIA